MADNREAKDIHAGYRFWVEIDSIQIAGFSECSAISIETEVFEYAEGGRNDGVHKLPVRIKHGNITLKRGMDPGGDLFAWYKLGLDGQPKARKNVSILMYAPEKDKVVRRYNLTGAWPVKWTGADMKTDSGAVAIETLEFAYSGLVDSSKS
ncbi:MAG: phage tail protein [Fimbriimonas sp.]